MPLNTEKPGVERDGHPDRWLQQARVLHSSLSFKIPVWVSETMLYTPNVVYCLKYILGGESGGDLTTAFAAQGTMCLRVPVSIKE